MADSDFFDDDLLPRKTTAAEPRREARPAEPPAPPAPPPTRDMAQHLGEVEQGFAEASREIELLRQRQEDLEKTRRDLESLRGRHDKYDRGRREMLDNLRQSLTSLERDIIRTDQVLTLLTSARERFRGMLDEIETLDEDAWVEGDVRAELTKSLALLEDARVEYNKALAKIQTIKEDAQRGAPPAGVVFEETRHFDPEDQPFSFWLKIGLAVSLPLLVVLILVGLLVSLLGARPY